MFGASCADRYPEAISAWRAAMDQRPRLAAFLASERCEPVLYPELLAK